MNRISELEELIRHHKALYYQGRPDIDDNKYDKLEEELKKLDPDNNALSIVGSTNISGVKVKHDSKMLSLNKTYKEDDLKTWIGDEEVVSTLKIDGVSCSLVYENGKLLVGKTRGDGSHGEDITPKVSWIKNIPATVSKKNRIEVRGEIYCTEEDFFHLSEEMVSIELEKPTSQRNIVAGLIGRKENIELCRYITFKAFDLISENPEKTEMEKSHSLKKMGFDIPVVILHKGFKRVQERLNEAKVFMAEGDYQIDGIVFSYNKLSLHNELGETAHHPRYKMAFKYQGISKETKIEKIIWSISRNGILTPVANVEPVELSGAKISRVTLHNFGLVRQYNLKEGDLIEIVRSGEVIPKFLSVIKPSDNKFTIPVNCPSCDSKVVEEDIRLFCSNKNCPGKLKESILNFIQKIGIDDLSSKRLDEMIKAGFIKEIPDLYKLKREKLLTLDKVKDKLADKLLGAIEKSKSVDLITFLSSLGIHGGAYNKCEKVVHAGFNSIEKILSLTEEELITIDSFAEKSSMEYIKSLKEKNKLINSLLKVGFNFEEVEIIETPISKMKICITGSLTEKRSIIESRIRDAGGIVVTSVSKNTDMLLTNETEAKSSKFKKAQQLEIKIISEDGLVKLLGI